MADRAASVPYEGVPTVSAGGGGGTPSGVRASAEDFGGQIGGALSKAGDQLGDVATKFNGMIMETAANQAETGYITEAGKLTNKFRSLEGLSAQAAIPQYEQDMINLRQSIRTSLPGGAARMFDATTSRHESYAISDAYGYGATQVKKATLDSNNAIAETAVSQAGNLAVAGNDTRFGEALGNIHHSVQSMMELQGYGQYVTADKDGNATFQDSPEGKQAEAVYNSELDKRTGAAWSNRLEALSSQNVETAYKVFQANRDKIPGDAQVKLDAYFTPKVKDYQARNDADSILAKHGAEFKNILANTQVNSNPAKDKPFSPEIHALIDTKADEIGVPRDIAHAVAMQESGENMNPKGSNDGGKAVGVFQLHEGAASDVDADRSTPEGNVSGGLKYLKSLHDKYGDWDKAIAAYNVGAGTLDAAGGDITKVPRAQEYVKNVTARMGGQKIQTTALVPSEADYYRSNYQQVMDEARTQAQAQHPDDPSYADTAVSKVEQRMNTVIKAQELDYKASSDLAMRGASGEMTKGVRPKSLDELRAISPEMSSAIDSMAVNNPQAYMNLETRVLTANARGADKDSREYGSGFYDLFKRVHADSQDPNRVKDIPELWGHVGPDGDLTMAGLDKLTKEMQGKGTPEGAAESDMRKQFFANAKAQISGKNEAFGIPDSKGEDQYLKFMVQTFPLIEKLKADGKTAAQIFDRDSPDYAGKLISAFKRPMAQQLADMQRDAQAATAGLSPPGARTVTDIVKEVRATTDPAKREALRQELLHMGAIRESAPQVPRPQ